MKLKKVLLYVVPPVVIIGVIYFINRQSIKKKISDGINNSPLPEPAKATTTTASQKSLFPLNRGSKNEKVTELQRILGFSGTDLDGDFGSMTETALKSFSGKTTVDSQAELDALATKKATQQNQTASISRAQELFNKFKAGGLNIFAQVDVLGYGYTADYAGAINYTGKNVSLPKGKTYSNNDYKLIGYTKAGNLQMQITRGDFAGTYVINPNNITLVK